VVLMRSLCRQLVFVTSGRKFLGRRYENRDGCHLGDEGQCLLAF